MIYIFGDCELDTQLYQLRRHGVPIKLGPKVFDVLAYLIRHRDRPIPKQELFDYLWPDQFVTDAALARCIVAARKVVNGSGGTQHVIETLYGRGYRFIATVQECPPAPPATIPPAAAQSSHHVEVQSPLPTAATPNLDTIHTNRNGAPSVVKTSEPICPIEGVLDGERKQVTVLCCALAHTTALAERLDPEALHHLMHGFFDQAWRQVQRYDGIIQQYTDNGLLAVFGLPVTHEDHALRAVLAARSIQSVLREPNVNPQAPHCETLTVHIGIHSGQMIGRRIGDDRRMTYMALGDTTRLTMHLQRLAEPGVILLSPSAARLTQEMVRVEADASVLVAGHTHPITAYRLLRVNPAHASFEGRRTRPLTRFVGRERKLSTLHALLERAANGQGQVVGVVGEPGMGKSRLLYEFRRSVQGQPVQYLTGRCVSYGSRMSYLPVLQILRHYCGMTDTERPKVVTTKLRQRLQEVGLEPAVWAPYFRHLLGVQADTDRCATLSPQTIKDHISEALVRLYLYSSRQRPLVLEIENLHWIDAASEAWLATLVERLPHAAILVVVTYRPGYRPVWIDKSYAMQLPIPQLLPDHGRQVAQAVLGHDPISESLVQHILTKADGNPFFLEELAYMVREPGDRCPTLAVPDTIQAVIAARIDRLPAEVKHVLYTAAVIGREVPIALLMAVTDLPDEVLHASLTHLLRAEFLYETDCATEPVYCFKHVLTQEVAYHALLTNTRQRIQQRIAHALTEKCPHRVAAQSDLQAHHHTQAGLNGFTERVGTAHAVEANAMFGNFK